MTPTVVFLGGNGHTAERLGPARQALARLTPAPFTLTELALPGFEDRPRAPTFEAFLAELSAQLDRAAPALIYATGIGGLLALVLRSRGEQLARPLLLQAPVLWGLERRLMPRLLRAGLARAVLHGLFSTRLFQGWFSRKFFTVPPDPALRAAFFAGYARCGAAADFFAWLTPALLRDLEARFRERPAALEGVRVWWGGRDRVVTLQELRWTESALGVRWPVREFPAWGHYPMIDDPDAWVRALADELATTGPLP